MEQLRNAPLPPDVHGALQGFFDSIKRLQSERENEKNLIKKIFSGEMSLRIDGDYQG